MHENIHLQMFANFSHVAILIERWSSSIYWLSLAVCCFRGHLNTNEEACEKRYIGDIHIVTFRLMDALNDLKNEIQWVPESWLC